MQQDIRSVSDLDGNNARFSSATCREDCGNPGSKRWADIRSKVGVQQKARMMTAKEYCLCLAFARWTLIRSDCRGVFMVPVLPTKAEVITFLDYWLKQGHKISELIRKTGKAAKETKTIEELVEPKPGEKGEYTGEMLAIVVKLRTGKSESSLRRFIIASGMSYRKRMKYSASVLDAAINALKSEKPTKGYWVCS